MSVNVSECVCYNVNVEIDEQQRGCSKNGVAYFAFGIRELPTHHKALVALGKGMRDV
jgi:hypothetical protein